MPVEYRLVIESFSYERKKVPLTKVILYPQAIQSTATLNSLIQKTHSFSSAW